MCETARFIGRPRLRWKAKLNTFLIANEAKLVGYKMIFEASAELASLDAPFPPDVLSDDELEDLKRRLKNCMPVETLITDLWDWDLHFEESLEDDWYFAAVFGDPSGLGDCAEQLAAFFLDACNENDLDYDQHDDEESFDERVHDQAREFLLGWRKNVVRKYGADIKKSSPSI